MDNTTSEILWTLGAIIVILLSATAFLLYAYISKEETIKKMNRSHNKLMRSFNDLDEQAKLIVRTDLELNKTREEMDKRLNGLNALQRTSRQLSQALNETEVFQKITPGLFEDLGFTRALIATTNDAGILKPHFNLNFKDPGPDGLLKEIQADESL